MERQLTRALKAGVVTLTGTLALTACGGSGGSDAKSTSTTAGVGDVTFTAGPVTVQRTAAAGEAAPADVDALLAASAAYVRAASLDPMAGRSGALRSLKIGRAHV